MLSQVARLQYITQEEQVCFIFIFRHSERHDELSLKPLIHKLKGLLTRKE